MIGPPVLPGHALIFVTVIVFFALLVLATGWLWSALPIHYAMDLLGGGLSSPADPSEAK